MEFKLLGKTVDASEGIRNYMKIVSDYKKIADKAERELYQDYNKFFDVFIYTTYDCEKLINHYRGDALDNFVKRYVGETRKYLSEYGVYTLSDEEIWHEVRKGKGSISVLQHEFEEFIIELAEITEEKQKDDDWFAQKVKEKFKTRFFESCLRTEVLALGDFVVDFLKKNELLEIDFVYQDDALKAGAIYKNLADSNIPTDKKVELAISMIELDPRTTWYYEYIFNNFSDAKYEIVAIAQFYGIDLSKLIEKDIVSSYNLKTLNSEEDAIKMMEDLKETMRKYGVSKSAKEEELQQVLIDYDIQARTYEGVVYETREDRAKAQKDDLELNKLHGGVSGLDKETCKNFLTKIKAIQCTIAVKNKHIQLLENRIDTIDKEYLGKLLSDLPSYDEAKCNDLKEQIEQYDTSDEIKNPFISQVKGKIYSIWEKEDYERFLKIYMQTPVNNPEMIKQNMDLIMETGRTQVKDDFLAALFKLNEDAVTTAAKYVIAKESGSIATFMNMGKKDSYNALTLEGRVMHPAISEKIEELKAEKANGFFSGVKKSLFSRFGSSKK